MQYTISIILTSILVLSLLEFYLQYVHPQKLQYNHLLLLIGYVALFFCGFFFDDLPYIITPIIIVAVLFSKQYQSTTFSVLVVVCYSLQYFIVDKCDGQTILYSILIGIMACFSNGIATKKGDQIVYVLSMVFYGCTTIIILDFYFLNNLYLEHILYGCATIVISYVAGSFLHMILTKLWNKTDQLIYQGYTKDTEELNSILIKLRPDLHHIGQYSERLANVGAIVLQLPVYKCCTGARLYVIAMLSKEEYLKNGLSLTKEYHLPGIVKRSIRIFFQTDCKATGQVEGVIYLAGLIGAALLYNEEQRTKKLSNEKIIQNVFLKQIKNNSLANTGFDSNTLSLLYQEFVKELNKERKDDNQSNQ